MICWSEYYPYKLAGLLDPAQSKETLDAFQRDVKAYWAARASGNQTLKKCADRCRLNLLFVQWCIAYCASTNWTFVPHAMTELLATTFSGWLQSRIIENGNKSLRRMEQRNVAKVAATRASNQSDKLKLDSSPRFHFCSFQLAATLK